MLPDDGPNGPKHVGATCRDILSVSCNILCFNKECICWQKGVELIKMHGKTTIKIYDTVYLSRMHDAGDRNILFMRLTLVM
jgi:hypothetical protein